MPVRFAGNSNRCRPPADELVSGDTYSPRQSPGGVVMVGKAKKRKARVFTKEEILEDWKKAVKKGLGRKKLDPAIEATFGPLLLAKIQTQLDPPQSGDYNKDGPNTRAVGKTLGQICR